jgi:hypothetical protein
MRRGRKNTGKNRQSITFSATNSMIENMGNYTKNTGIARSKILTTAYNLYNNAISNGIPPNEFDDMIKTYKTQRHGGQTTQRPIDQSQEWKTVYESPLVKVSTIELPIPTEKSERLKEWEEYNDKDKDNEKGSTKKSKDNE